MNFMFHKCLKLLYDLSNSSFLKNDAAQSYFGIIVYSLWQKKIFTVAYQYFFFNDETDKNNLQYQFHPATGRLF
jgi:hypothetical protein